MALVKSIRDYSERSARQMQERPMRQLFLHDQGHLTDTLKEVNTAITTKKLERAAVNYQELKRNVLSRLQAEKCWDDTTRNLMSSAVSNYHGFARTTRGKKHFELAELRRLARTVKFQMGVTDNETSTAT